MQVNNFNKWNELLNWVVEKHDQAEASYHKTNFSSDQIEAATLRKVSEAMVNLARKEGSLIRKSAQATPPPVQTNLRKRAK